MKKYFLIIIVFVVLLTGCGKADKEKIKNNFIKETENLKGYYLEGKLSITNNDDNYKYNVEVSYSKQDYFKVNLTNIANNYKQTIMRNDDGVFVVTPSLNRSFKFRSEWPYNNSQSYLLQSLTNDLKADKNYNFEKTDKNYIFITKVSYPNNPTLVSQKITMDQTLNLEKVEVLDKQGIPHITFTVNNIDKKAVFSDNYFKLDTVKEEIENPKAEENNEQSTKNQEKESNNSVETNSNIDEALFPLYLPKNTSLTNRKSINTDVGQRVIMTFGGDASFILVQENVKKEEEFTVTPSYGEPYLLVDTVGALTDTSFTWISNGVEYYIVSDVIKQEELLEIAKSINVVATIGEK